MPNIVKLHLPTWLTLSRPDWHGNRGERRSLKMPEHLDRKNCQIVMIRYRNTWKISMQTTLSKLLKTLRMSVGSVHLLSIRIRLLVASMDKRDQLVGIWSFSLIKTNRKGSLSEPFLFRFTWFSNLIINPAQYTIDKTISILTAIPFR